MGAWGFETFENDDAMDWVFLLQESKDDSVLSETFSAIPKEVAEPADAPSACCALAAAETVAALLGRADPHLPEEVAAWGRNRSVTPDLVHEAQRSVSDVLSKSELRELWEESDYFERWKSSVENLTSRLSVSKATAGHQVAPSAEQTPSVVEPDQSTMQSPTQEPRSSAEPVTGGLRLQTQRFLQEVVPFEGYTSENVTEDILRRYVADAAWDPGAQVELRLCFSVVLIEISSGDFANYPAEQQDYLRSCERLLRGIMLEICGHTDPFDNVG